MSIQTERWKGGEWQSLGHMLDRAEKRSSNRTDQFGSSTERPVQRWLALTCLSLPGFCLTHNIPSFMMGRLLMYAYRRLCRRSS